uniref:L27 domain-containing protein n=1 Tax=Knipowitschia caucasica TaxID=637954 RepID=A0AAV2LDW0_KNICA
MALKSCLSGLYHRGVDSFLSEELQGKTSTAGKELLLLLSRPHVKSLLFVHDSVAQKDYEPDLPPLPDDLDDDEDSVKIIRLVKNKEPLDCGDVTAPPLSEVLTCDGGISSVVSVVSDPQTLEHLLWWGVFWDVVSASV